MSLKNKSSSQAFLSSHAHTLTSHCCIINQTIKMKKMLAGTSQLVLLLLLNLSQNPALIYVRMKVRSMGSQNELCVIPYRGGIEVSLFEAILNHANGFCGGDRSVAVPPRRNVVTLTQLEQCSSTWELYYIVSGAKLLLQIQNN